MKNKLTLWVVVILVILVGGWYLLGGSGSSLSTNAVARVNGENITKSELAEFTTRFFGGAPDDIDEATKKQLESDALNILIDQKLMSQEAKKAGLSVTDQEVNDEFEQLKLSIGGDEGVKEFLSAQGITESEFKTQLKNDLLIQKYFEQVSQSPDGQAGADIQTLLQQIREQAEIEILI